MKFAHSHVLAYIFHSLKVFLGPFKKNIGVITCKFQGLDVDRLSRFIGKR